MLFAAASSVLFLLLTRDVRLTLIYTLFPPSWLMQACTGMSEPAYLALLLASLWAFSCRRMFVSGLCMALAALVRPTALFLFAGIELALWREKRWAHATCFAALSSLGPLTTIGINDFYYGDALRQVTLHKRPENIPEPIAQRLAPDGKLRTFGYWPLKALIQTPLLVPTPRWKVVYVAAHVVAVLTACAVALYRFSTADILGRIMCIWLVGNTGFILCTGPYWGFHSFDRYFLWALPAVVYSLGQVRVSDGLVAVAATASLGLSTWALSRREPLPGEVSVQTTITSAAFNSTDSLGAMMPSARMPSRSLPASLRRR